VACGRYLLVTELAVLVHGNDVIQEIKVLAVPIALALPDERERVKRVGGSVHTLGSSTTMSALLYLWLAMTCSRKA
jgi:hypothetical protein